MKSRKVGASATGGALDGKVAVVTGASRGIGLAIAKALALQACHVVIAGRSEATLDSALQSVIGARKAQAEHSARRAPEPGQTAPDDSEIPNVELGSYGCVCDVRSEKDVRSLFRFVDLDFGRVDILINNAGMAHALRNIQDLPLETWREVLDTNLTGMFLCTRAALPLMRRGGVIVNNLSVAARGVFPGESAYCASKHGALGFTDTLREELRGRGIRVISLLPGPTTTGIWDQFMPEAPRDKMMSPQTVARVVIAAIMLPETATVEELRIGPTEGNV